MDLRIEIPDEIGAAFDANGVKTDLSAARYATYVIEKTLAQETKEDRAVPPFETGYGMWAEYGPAPPDEEIDENRRGMLRNFARDFE